MQVFNYDNVKEVRTHDGFNRPLKSGMFSRSLTQLHFGSSFDQPLHTPSIANTTFTTAVTTPLPLSRLLPHTLTSLTLGKCFNQEILPSVMPPTLTRLAFGSHFNHPFQPHALPPTLLHLSFGSGFDQPLSREVRNQGEGHESDTLPILLASLLPPHLISLTLGSQFNHPLQGALSSSLLRLHLGSSFEHPLRVVETHGDAEAWILPPNLSTLTFGKRSTNSIASSVEHLARSFGCDDDDEGEDANYLYNSHEPRFNPAQFGHGRHIAQTLAGDNAEPRVGERRFPVTERQASPRGRFSHLSRLHLMPFSTNLTRLEFGRHAHFNQTLTVAMLPRRLRVLRLGPSFNRVLLRGVFPETLTSLHFGHAFNQLLEEERGRAQRQGGVVSTLPSRLTTLSFGRSFNREIPSGVLPHSLTRLCFGDDFNQALGSHELAFGRSASSRHAALSGSVSSLLKQPTDADPGKGTPPDERILPQSLTYLQFGDGFQQPLGEAVIGHLTRLHTLRLGTEIIVSGRSQ